VKALVKSREERGLWLVDVPEPEMGINDVKIRVLATGICGTVSALRMDGLGKPRSGWFRKWGPGPMVQFEGGSERRLRRKSCRPPLGFLDLRLP